MRYVFSRRFDRSFKKFPKHIQIACSKQLKLLLQNIKHPSLRAKKYNETGDVWQARVNDTIRFYFVVRGDIYFLVDIEKHKD